MNTKSQMNTMTGQSDRQDTLQNDGAYDAEGRVTLDKSVPEIGEAFANCKEGDMYKVISDDDSEIVLEKQPETASDDTTADDTEPDTAQNADENMPKSDNPAVALIIARKNKR